MDWDAKDKTQRVGSRREKAFCKAATLLRSTFEARRGMDSQKGAQEDLNPVDRFGLSSRRPAAGPKNPNVRHLSSQSLGWRNCSVADYHTADSRSCNSPTTITSSTQSDSISIDANAGFTGSSWPRSRREPSAVTVFSEWYFLTVNRPPFSESHAARRRGGRLCRLHTAGSRAHASATRAGRRQPRR
jgi:hypothetical protein